jgi:DNA-binding NtrC family response regulator
MNQLQVLIASSDTKKRDVLAAILVRYGVRPQITTNASGVRAAFARGPVHLVFCEDELPEGGFREVLRIANATRPAVPIVVCSRLGEIDQYLEVMEKGAFDFIISPYRCSEIEFILQRAWMPASSQSLGRKRIRDRNRGPAEPGVAYA